MTRKKPLTLKERIRRAKKAGKKIAARSVKFGKSAADFAEKVSIKAEKIEKARAKLRRDFQGPQIDQDFFGFDVMPRKRRRRR